MFLSSLDAGIDPEKLIIGIITDLPKGDYRFSTIVDLVFDDYGPMLCYSIRKEHFLGLSAISSDRNEKINGKLFHASFTHDLEKINIT